MGIASVDRAGPAQNEGRTDRLTGLIERLAGDAGRLDRAIGGLRRSKMRCGHSVAVRVGAIEKCGHMRALKEACGHTFLFWRMVVLRLAAIRGSMHEVCRH